MPKPCHVAHNIAELLVIAYKAALFTLSNRSRFCSSYDSGVMARCSTTSQASIFLTSMVATSGWSFLIYDFLDSKVL
jgi:hypothetical protein